MSCLVTELICSLEHILEIFDLLLNFHSHLRTICLVGVPSVCSCCDGERIQAVSTSYVRAGPLQIKHCRCNCGCQQERQFGCMGCFWWYAARLNKARGDDDWFYFWQWVLPVYSLPNAFAAWSETAWSSLVVGCLGEYKMYSQTPYDTFTKKSVRAR